MTVKSSARIAGAAETAEGQSDYIRIELVWPGKDQPLTPWQEPDGRWRLQRKPRTRRLYPLVALEHYGDPVSGVNSLAVAGDRLAALSTLRRRYPHSVQFAYLDVPRIEIDDRAAAFQGDPTYAYSTWLSVMRAHLGGITPLLARAGIVAIHTGDLEEPYARLLAAECLGRDNYVGTIVWQRSYGPRNMRGMKEFTATHDCILLFAVDKSSLRPVGLREGAAAAGFANPDADPRGPWKAAHKGARTRRARSDFNAYVPPYRWRIVDGRLPDGLWRLNPLTGVIWGEPTEIGDFPIVFEVVDSVGHTATSSMVLRSQESGTPAEPPVIPWLFTEVSTRGRLKISTRLLPDAILGKEYSAMLLGEGGSPYTASPKRPGSGRYWEFADETLRQAYGRDKVDLGDDGNVIPRIKTYAETLGGEVVRNQQTWWPAKARDGSSFTGFTQDATKHLKKLQEMGLLTEAVTSSKPEHLLARLLTIFTSPDDVVLEVFGTTADLAAVAVKTGRPFVYLSGTAARETALFERCALPRLRAVVDGKDNDLQIVESEIRMSPDSYIPYGGGGSFATARVGDWLFEQGPREDYPRLNRRYGDPADLASAVLTSQGFVPSRDDPMKGEARDGGRALVVPPDEHLTPDLAARLISESDAPSLTVFYYMSAEDFDPSLAPPEATFQRVPSEITLFER